MAMINPVRFDTWIPGMVACTKGRKPRLLCILQEACLISLPRFAWRASFLICLCVPDLLYADEPVRTLQSFGVQMKGGQPVFPLPKNVAMGLFNPDPLLDIANYADGKIQVWQNQGNGLFEFVGERPATGEIESMEWEKEHMWSETIIDQFSWGRLRVRYVDGRNGMILRQDIVPFHSNFHVSNGIPSAPPIDFREVWRSQSQTQPSRFMAIGDLDNDGNIEIAYAFYQFSNDSTHLVVYTCLGNDSFAIAWDTIMIRTFGPFAITDVDKDGHKEIVLGRSLQGEPGAEVVLLECLGPGSYKLYTTNITYYQPPFKALEADINHNGRNEIVWHTSDPSPPPGGDATFIHIAEFDFKTATSMSFNRQLARYGGYTFDMAVGQIDGAGRDEIIPSGGSFGFHEPVPIDYLWYNGTTWVVRQIHTGLQSGTTAEMFVNLDADTTKELFIGGVRPVGRGSCYALKYVSDTTWTVLWADSSLRNTPLSVNAGILGGQFVVAGANTIDRGSLDTLYTDLNVYQPSGIKLGIWRRDTASVQNFHFLDIDNDGVTNLVAPIISHLIPDHLAVYEYSGTLNVTELSGTVPERFELSQNYPNPFNPATSFTLTSPVQGYVRISVYDLLGREIKRILDETCPPGQQTLLWNGDDNQGNAVSTGVYFIRMQASSPNAKNFLQTRKVVLIR